MRVSQSEASTVTREVVEAGIFGLLAQRAPGASICPSEVARALASAPSSWRALMPLVREVAQRLALCEQLVVTSKGIPVDALRHRGPIRLVLPVERMSTRAGP